MLQDEIIFVLLPSNLNYLSGLDFVQLCTLCMIQWNIVLDTYNVQNTLFMYSQTLGFERIF